MRKLILLILLIPSIPVLTIAQNTSIELNKNWFFRKQGNTYWLPATVPGTVHTDLMDNGVIRDPFIGENEKKVQWIEKLNWEYQTQFDIDERTYTKKNIELVFDGLDTYADVFLNDKLILQADNMFRGWRIDVKPLLKRTDNKLFIRFYSAQNKVDSIAKSKLPFVLPDNPRVYARKAQYSFGWDFAPKLTTCGIWKSIRLIPNEFHFTCRNTYPDSPWNIKLIQYMDSAGKSFEFQANGKPIYIKGANWVPADVFLPRVKKDDYRKLLLMAKEAHINMLRIWGGGVYEDDCFYDLCDSLGIMVWQDFMFAGGMVPGDEHFFNNVKEEVKYHVGRLRVHPCIVLWCGNNEIDEAWHNWDWQQQFNLHGEDSARVWNDYKRLFEDSLKAWVNEYDGNRPYISSSPMHGWGRKESITEGDSHYWGVWWGLEDIDVFEKKTGRFVSEYGMQAMPNTELSKGNSEKEGLYSSTLKAHQKHPTGFETLKYYLNRYFLDSNKVDKLSLDDYTYLTNCLQYYTLKNIIAIHRSKYPVNMGTMVWQLNDCWPGVTWSIIDHGKRPKGGYYAMKEAYRDDLLPKKDSIAPKDLHLKKPTLKVTVNGDKVFVTCDTYAKYVYLSADNNDILFSDNYFNLKEGETKEISYKGKLSKLTVRTLWDIIK
jgi:beta-mannosidase